MREPAWLIALIVLLPAPHAAAQGVAYEGACSFATGRYGEPGADRTTTFTLTNGASYSFGRATLRFAWPVHLQRGDAVTTVGGGTVGHRGDRPSGSAGPMHGAAGTAIVEGAHTEFVLGDPMVRAAWRALDALDTRIAFEVSAKAPLAEPEAYGTGEWDFGAGASLRRTVAWPVSAAAAADWWRLGDPPGIDYRDMWVGVLSLDRQGSAGTVSVRAAVATPAVAGDDPAASVGIGFVRSRGTRDVGLHASVGLTDTASDVYVGLSLRMAAGSR